MSIAHCLENYLSRKDVDYRVVSHGFTQSAYDSANAAHVPSRQVVKAILLKDTRSGQHVMALIPASNKLKLLWVNQEFQSDLMLAGESEIAARFPDCVLGAVPGFGQAYDVPLIWDEQLSEQDRLYFEAGSHKDLIEISRGDFKRLFEQHPHTVISLAHESYALFHADELRGGLH